MKSLLNTAGPSNFCDIQSQKLSTISDQVESDVNHVRFDKNSILMSETNVSTEPTYDFSKLDPNFDALNNSFGKINVDLPSVK